ncbi:hypothetical protein AX15_003488 [Amanita polypyramis BW_CC]|nr:hypothetical protein AX15_003488 [Amanita polypyramis BW_CC]
MSNPRPIVVVTGANGGVGLGICQRLLSQLCSKEPSDAGPQQFALSSDGTDTSSPYASCDGITLIMACRSIKRAELARLELLKHLDARVAFLKTRPNDSGHAERFRKNVDIVVMQLDLADLRTVFHFAGEVVSRYPYVSHLICNAGLASFDRIYWFSAIKQVILHPMNAVTRPTFYLQHKGEESVDGLGWVWQCNFFGHFVLFRAIESLLSKSPITSRVIWMSSLEASPVYYNPDDWQCKATSHSYETTKYETDLVGSFLDRLSLQDSARKRARHFIAHPGICSTSISNALVGPVLNMLKLLMFYIVRFWGSPHHTIDPFKAAISAVHLALAPLVFFASLTDTHISTGYSSSKYTNGAIRHEMERPPVRFGAETDRWGTEHVGLTPVEEWKRFEMEAEYLLAKCNALYEKMKEARTKAVTATI